MTTLELDILKNELAGKTIPPCQFTIEELRQSIKRSQEDVRNGRVKDQDKVFEEMLLLTGRY